MDLLLPILLFKMLIVLLPWEQDLMIESRVILVNCPEAKLAASEGRGGILHFEISLKY